MFREMRRFKQQTSREECVKLLQTERRGVLSIMGEDGYPYGFPMNFVYDEAADTVYFHTAKQGHKLDAIRELDKACFTIYGGDYKEGDDWAWYVTSVVCFGRLEVVENPEISMASARKLGEKYFPTAEMVDYEMENSYPRVTMLAFHIDHMTGKLVHED